jgi:hypothetical protein
LIFNEQASAQVGALPRVWGAAPSQNWTAGKAGRWAATGLDRREGRDARMLRLGLLGGMSWESSALYYREPA